MKKAILVGCLCWLGGCSETPTAPEAPRDPTVSVVSVSSPIGAIIAAVALAWEVLKTYRDGQQAPVGTASED